MKTKPFLLATAGSTVDGRTISDKDIDDIVSSFNPQTYGARINIEHIRGVSGTAPFNAYGDVVSVSSGEVEVDFNGKKEKRKALYGVLDVTDNAKALNDAGQKVYPSIEIIDDFNRQGYAYLGGLALTDSPASIATERMKFNRFNPNNRRFSLDEGALLEFEVESTSTEAKGLLAGFGAMLDSFAAKFAPPAKEEKKEPEGQQTQNSAFSFAELRPMLEEVAQTFNTALDNLRKEFREEADRTALAVKKLGEEQESTPAHNFTRRQPSGSGSAGNYDKIF